MNNELTIISAKQANQLYKLINAGLEATIEKYLDKRILNGLERKGYVKISPFGMRAKITHAGFQALKDRCIDQKASQQYLRDLTNNYMEQVRQYTASH